MKFLLDHDVPDEVARSMAYWKYDVQCLRDVLPITSTDEAIFNFAQREGLVLVSCNRDHYLGLARKVISKQFLFAGLIILIRRRTRQSECSHLLSLLRRAGENGINGNLNLA